MKFTIALAALFGISLCGRQPALRPADNCEEGDDDGNTNIIRGNDNDVSGDNNRLEGWRNTLYGDSNRLRGANNVNIGSKTSLQGCGNWIVGVGHKLRGNNIKMFGPDANPYFVRGGSSSRIPCTFD